GVIQIAIAFVPHYIRRPQMTVELRSRRPGSRWVGLKDPSRLPPVFHVGGAADGDTGTGAEQVISVSFPDHHGIVNINLSCKADLAEHEAAQQTKKEMHWTK